MTGGIGMFQVQMTFARSIEREQERSDEGQLPIAGITISGGVVAVHDGVRGSVDRAVWVL